MTELLAFTASAFGIAMGLAPALQTRQIIAFRITEGISLTYPAIISSGALIWVLYGLSIGNWFLVVPNVIGAVSASSVLLSVLYFRKSGAKESGRTPTKSD